MAGLLASLIFKRTSVIVKLTTGLGLPPQKPHKELLGQISVFPAGSALPHFFPRLFFIQLWEVHSAIVDNFEKRAQPLFICRMIIRLCCRPHGERPVTQTASFCTYKSVRWIADDEEAARDPSAKSYFSLNILWETRWSVGEGKKL